MAERSKGCCDSFHNFLRNIDYFGVTFNFRINKQPAYSSSTGGCWFLVFIIFAIAFIGKSALDYLGGNQFSVIFIDKAIHPAPKLNSTDLQFGFAFRVTFDNNQPLNGTRAENLFNITSNYVVNKFGKKKKKPVSTRPCTKEDFYGAQNDSIFTKTPVSEFECVDNLEDMDIYGLYTDKEMAYFEYQISISNNFMGNYSEVEDIFLNNQFKVTLYYVDTLNDVSSSDEPIFYTLNAQYTYIDLPYFKRENINFQEFVYAEDNNLLYENYKNNTFMQVANKEEISVSMSQRDKTNLEDKLNLVKFFFRGLNNQKQVLRSYQKIPTFLANLSGLLVNGLVALAIVMTFVNKFKAKQTIMHKILKYKENIKDENQDNLRYLKENFKQKFTLGHGDVLVNSNDNQSGDFITQNNQIDTNINLNIEQITNANSNKNFNKAAVADTNMFEKVDLKEKLNKNDDHDSIFDSKRHSGSFSQSVNNHSVNESQRSSYSKSNPMLITCKDICCLICCCRSIKNKKTIYDDAEVKFNHYIDLITYMKKMEEIDILKYMLLNEDSLNLMDFISKPSVSIKKSHVFNKEYQKFFNTEIGNSINTKMIDRTKKSYMKIMENEDMSRTDKRLIQLFDMQIEDLYH